MPLYRTFSAVLFLLNFGDFNPEKLSRNVFFCNDASVFEHKLDAVRRNAFARRAPEFCLHLGCVCIIIIGTL